MNTPGPVSRNRFRFEKLEVWQEARRLNVEIYRMVGRLPSEENFGLSSQIRRACVSVAANIAEGAGRNSDRDFAHFLEQAYASAMELASHLYLVADLGYVDREMVEPCLERIDQLAIRIAALNRSLAVAGSKVKL
jgi:four helix bundle protein